MSGGLGDSLLINSKILRNSNKKTIRYESWPRSQSLSANWK